MKSLAFLDPHRPWTIDSFEFLYQAMAKEVSAVYVPVRDGLAIAAGCYILKKFLPLPYYVYRTMKLYFFPYRINSVLVKTSSIKDDQSNVTSFHSDDEHWALINDCTTPSGCAFAQNLAVDLISIESFIFHLSMNIFLRDVATI